MKQFLISLTAIIIMHQHSVAQTTQDSVKAVIDQLFTALRNADAASFVETFESGAVLQTIETNEKGQTIIRNESLKEFTDMIGTFAKGDADERITYETIKIDGELAIAWTPYNFFYKGQYVHCGTDAFTLVRTNGKWKIVYLIDTRRSNCH